MSNIYKNVIELIGKTPLVEVENVEKRFKLQARLLVKLDGYNPAGSAKDRIAYQMIVDAEETGKLKEGSVIIEPTSGNTGIGLAAIGASKGYRVILTMPETMSVERRNLLKAYGAEIVLTDGSQGMKGAITKAEELAEEIEDAFIAGQFVNPSNTESSQTDNRTRDLGRHGRRSRYFYCRSWNRRNCYRSWRIFKIQERRCESDRC